MDLSNLKTAQESRTLNLTHPSTGEILKAGDAPEDGSKDLRRPFTIDLLSSDTNNYKSEFNKLMKEARDQKGEQTARQAEEKACGMLAKVTTGWHLVMDGKPLEFTTEAAKDLYFNPEYTWIREQVEAFMRDRSNFIQGSLKA